MPAPGAGPVEQRTRQQIRQSIGYQTGAMDLATATATAGTTGFTDASRVFGGADEFKGYYLVGTTGSNIGEIHRVQASTTGGVMSITTANPWTSQPPVGAQIELWQEDMNPLRIHDFINRAIVDITRKAAPPTVDFSIHVGRNLYTYVIPTSVIGIQQLSFRKSFTSLSLDSADAVWTASDAVNVTPSVDTEDFREGSGSNKFVLAAALAAGSIAYRNITSVNLARYTHIEYWIKSTVATTSGQLTIRLSSTNAIGTATDDTSVPALVANTWTYVRTALGNPQTDTAIVSVGLRQPTDIGAATVWIDDVRVVEQYSEKWEELNPSFWWIDQDARNLVLTSDAYNTTSYSLLKIDGVKKPTLLTADATVCECDSEYVINKAIALAYRASADRKGANYEARLALADKYENAAALIRARLQTPTGTRWVSDP